MGMDLPFVTRCRRFVTRLARDHRGVAAVFLAVSLVPMAGAVGLAIDSSIGYLLKTRMSKSLDAAGLAAGRIALDENADEQAEEFFNANFGTSVGNVHLDDFTFDLDDTGHFVTLTATATTPTYFMRIFGHDEMTVSARTVIERQTTGMELALVLDNTGSMWGTPFSTMKAAAEELVDILYGDEDEIENLWVSVVPYTATINIGPGRTGWIKTSDRVHTNPAAFSPDTWRGCIMARANPRDANDDPPGTEKWSSFLYPATTRTQDNKWPPLVTSIADQNKGTESNRNTARGPNLGCPSSITPLTASRATIDAALDAMGPVHRGGTASNLGLAWGWRTLSPRWRGLWGGDTPADLPLDYGTDFMDKVVVLLTDGNNNFHDQDTASGTPKSDFTAYGRLDDMGVSTTAQGRALLDARMAGSCTAMKAEGIRIYTIIFGGAPDTTTRNLFTNCATNPSMYYYAPNNADLAKAFRAIGGQLANLLIVE